MKKLIPIHLKVREYLSYRRTFGFALRIEGEQLMNFARFAKKIDHRGSMTLDLAVKWAKASSKKTPLTWARRLEVLRPFAKHLSIDDPKTEIPPQKLFGPAHRRIQPHIFSDDEINALLNSCLEFKSPDGLRPATYYTLFGLIAATGLRISEALNLKMTDVNLNSGILTIRETKFKKSRLVPLHRTVVKVLKKYRSIKDKLKPMPLADTFFISDKETPLIYSTVRHTYSRIIKKLQWKPGPSGLHPRIHDLRHTFACKRLLTWHKKGLDVNNRIAGLSVYMGHAKVSDTYWYLTGIPKLMRILSNKFENFTNK